MTTRLEIRFARLTDEPASPLVLLAAAELALGGTAQRLDAGSGGALARAAQAAAFTGKRKAAIEVLGVPGLPIARLLLIGAGKLDDMTDVGWTALGGAALGQIQVRKSSEASLVCELEGLAGEAVAGAAAGLALGAVLRAYTFEKYLTKKREDDNGEAQRDGLRQLVIHVADPQAADAAWQPLKAVAEGVCLARDLVNEPANELGPVEFAERCAALRADGLDVDVLEEPALRDLGMRALLGVSQGSARPARVVVMHWNGAKGRRGKAADPLCFIGKGVVFDTGGLSMKPAAGMEDMKGDMGGAACVTGLMCALARRKARVNAVGLVGLVENMPSGTAQRPGDIVRSMSGQTIEVLNTDAEGRLVLADVMWYAQQRFEPRMMVELSTLTGAIMVALGKEHAGLFSNDDELARALSEAGEATGERVWRMPLGPAYDKLIDSKNADMKNIGGRYGGAITAAQFLQRFVKDKDTPWAHIDIAGTAMDSSKNDINQSWGSGWGVRLLDRLVTKKYGG